MVRSGTVPTAMTGALSQRVLTVPESKEKGAAAALDLGTVEVKKVVMPLPQTQSAEHR